MTALPKMGPYPLVELQPREVWDISQREIQRRRKAQRLADSERARSRAADIIARVAAVFGFTVDQLRSRASARALVDARRVACYLARKITGLCFEQLGELLARTHAAVSHVCRSVSRKLARWPTGSTALALAQAEEACA
jgi:chromosomal replication initiation ATPase DnaA